MTPPWCSRPQSWGRPPWRSASYRATSPAGRGAIASPQPGQGSVKRVEGEVDARLRPIVAPLSPPLLESADQTLREAPLSLGNHADNALLGSWVGCGWVGVGQRMDVSRRRTSR